MLEALVKKVEEEIEKLPGAAAPFQILVSVCNREYPDPTLPDTGEFEVVGTAVISVSEDS